MKTISLENLKNVTGGQAGQGHGPGPNINGCQLNAMAEAGRIVDDVLPAPKHSDAERKEMFLPLRDSFANRDGCPFPPGM